METRNSTTRNSFDSPKTPSSVSEKVKKTTDGKVVWQFSAKKGNENQLQKKKAMLSPLLTKFSSSYVQESFVEEEEDDSSIQFSVDPDMLKKLNLRKLHFGEEYAPNDSDKILQFQLDRDIKKLIDVKGSFRERSKKFLSLRKNDPVYVQMSSAPKVALNGDFREVINRSIEASWRETSKPYGEIAHKRYLEYLANLPKGPTEAEIIAVQQKKVDTDLWENIKYGRTELTLKQRREQRLQDQDSQLAHFVNENKVDIHRKERLRKAAIEQDRYDLLRVLPTRNQHEDSMVGWSRGTNYPFDFESSGYPQIQEEKEFLASASLGIVEDRRLGYGGPRNKTLRVKHHQQINEKYMGERTIEKGFWHYMSNIRLNAAIDSIEESKKKQSRMKHRRGGVSNILVRDQESVPANILKAQAALLQDGDKLMSERDEQHWQPSSLHWEPNRMLRPNGYLRSLIDLTNLNFWRQSQYRAKVYPADGSVDSDSIIDFSWLIKLLDKFVSKGEPRTDIPASERSAKRYALAVAEENLKNVRSNITKARRCLQEDEKRLRPNPARMLRGLVSKQRMKEYAMAKRRLETLESHAEQVLALKQKEVDDAAASLAALQEEDPAPGIASVAPVSKEDSVIDASGTLPIAPYALMRSQENEEKMRHIVQQRQDEKKKQQSRAKLENKIFCRSEEQQRDVDGPRPTADDLVLAASSGRYKEVIDMIYHRFYPIDVTVPNSDGLTATYAVLRLLLQDALPSTAGGDKEDLFGDLLGDTMQRMKNRVVGGVYRFLGIDYQQIRRRNQRQQSMDVVLQLLISHGGRVEDKHGDYDTDKLSVLHLAAASGGLPMMQWLLDAGVDVNIRTEFGKTPLMFSVESGSLPAMVLLLRSGAMKEINVVDRDGNTALHIAARKASVEFAQLLLACDASLRLRNRDGLTAEDLASRSGRTAMAVTLSSFLPPQGEFRHRIAFMMQQFAADSDSLDDVDEVMPEDDNVDNNVEYAGAEELEEEKVQEVIADHETEDELKKIYSF